ncbi:hypothetical protein RJ639_004893 [Escallonia herrerae]|uniref:Integrase catalytic domain-containing protein n=1 Tax=Escallonia herrerae TaxID=1293975 RepID=A0AA89AWM2_9ASTE|nr:hypothetical protein RJ639_004893 [Escallonia herrerae]
MPLYGFSNHPVTVKGIIALLVAIGTPPMQANFMLDFVVVKVPSTFNGILGRPALNWLQAVVSTYHLKMKFPTEHGIGGVKGDQTTTRQCYMASCQSKNKEALIIEDLREDTKMQRRKPVEELSRRWTDKYEYEALLIGIRLAHALKVDSLSVHSDSQLVVNHVLGDYKVKDERMAQYLQLVKMSASKFKNFTIRQIPRDQITEVDTLSRLASAKVTDARHSVYLEFLKDRSISSQTEIRMIDQEPCWMYMIIIYLSTGELPSERHEARNLCVKAARVPRALVIDNEKQFDNNNFRTFCTNLSIDLKFTSVAHPQSNGQIKNMNHSILQGLKKKLDEAKGAWVNELPKMLRRTEQLHIRSQEKCLSYSAMEHKQCCQLR